MKTGPDIEHMYFKTLVARNISNRGPKTWSWVKPVAKIKSAILGTQSVNCNFQHAKGVFCSTAKFEHPRWLPSPILPTTTMV